MCDCRYCAGVSDNCEKDTRGAKFNARVFHLCSSGEFPAVSSVMRCTPDKIQSSRPSYIITSTHPNQLSQDQGHSCLFHSVALQHRAHHQQAGGDEAEASTIIRSSQRQEILASKPSTSTPRCEDWLHLEHDQSKLQTHARLFRSLGCK